MVGLRLNFAPSPVADSILRDLSFPDWLVTSPMSILGLVQQIVFAGGYYQPLRKRTKLNIFEYVLDRSFPGRLADASRKNSSYFKILLCCFVFREANSQS